MTIHTYWSSACPKCPIKNRCTPSDYRRIRRWEHEEVLEAMQRRLDHMPDALKLRRSTVEIAPIHALIVAKGCPLPDEDASEGQNRDEPDTFWHTT